MKHYYHLGHKFKNSSSPGSYNIDFDINHRYTCELCGCQSVYWDRIFYKKHVRYYEVATVSNRENVRLTITCNEQIIKNLLE